MNFILNDYHNWVIDNELIIKLKENNSNIYFHIESILDTLDKLYDKQELDNDELNIFHVGFTYVFDYFNFIQLIYKNNCNEDIFILESYSKYLVYYTYLNELLDELSDMSSDLKDNISAMMKLILEFLDDEINDEEFMKLDNLITNMFNAEFGDFRGIVNIFNEIAENL